MPEEVTGIAPPTGDLNQSLLLPGSWEAPKERIPVEVVTFRMRWSDPAYNEAQSFKSGGMRPAFPKRRHSQPDGSTVEHNSVMQLDIQLKRLDAVYVHEDGSPFKLKDGSTAQTAPVVLYAGVDLEKLDQKNMVIKPLTKTRGKEQFIIKAWTDVFGPLAPNAERLEGTMLWVTRYRELEISPGFPATNVTVPEGKEAVLPPTFTYTGEVQKFKASNRDVDEGAVASAASAGLGASGLSKEDAAKKIGEFLKAQKVKSPQSSDLGRPGFPIDARIEPFVSAFMKGTIVDTLGEYGVTL